MVRTMAGGQRKAVASKAPRKTGPAPSSSGGGSSSAPSPGRAGKSSCRTSGGNSYTHWDAPKWQKGIGSFFNKAVVDTSIVLHVTKPDDVLSSQDSTHTIDLNDVPKLDVQQIFGESCGSSSVSSGVSESSTDDVEQPGPSSTS